MRWGGKGVVTFVSGNRAMGKFQLNEMLHIARHQVPFSVMWVPLDPEGLEKLEKQGNGTVYDAIATDGRFTGERSNFRQVDYNRMALVKWELSIAIMELGYDVFLLDPDIVPLRNPLPYFETLGACDMYFQLDTSIMPTGDNVKSQGGYPLPVDGLEQFFNTGGILMRASERTLAFLRKYHAHATAEYAGGTQYDDQGIFNR